MSLFMCIQSITVTSLYLHSLVYILFELFWFLQYFFFPWNTLQTWSCSVPEYFEDYGTMSSCNSVVKEQTQAQAWHKDWSVFIFWELKLSYQFTTWPADCLQHGMQFCKPL